MKTTILKTAQLLEHPLFGFDKLIIHFPNGAGEPSVGGTNDGLYIQRKSYDGNLSPYTIKVYNGKLLRHSDNSDLYDSYRTVTTDDYGNTVSIYSFQSTTYPSNNAKFHITAETTRIEIVNYKHDILSAFYGGDAYSARTGEKGAIDLRQYALLDSSYINCTHNASYGDLQYFKDRDDWVSIRLGGTKVTGNINNFVKAAAKEDGLTMLSFPYANGVYGELTDLLDVMSERSDVRGQTYQWYFYNTSVTYRGNLINQGSYRTIAFDAEGNYTVDGV